MYSHSFVCKSLVKSKPLSLYLCFMLPATSNFHFVMKTTSLYKTLILDTKLCNITLQT